MLLLETTENLGKIEDLPCGRSESCRSDQNFKAQHPRGREGSHSGKTPIRQFLPQPWSSNHQRQGDIRELKTCKGMASHACNPSTGESEATVLSSRSTWPMWWEPVSYQQSRTQTKTKEHISEELSHRGGQQKPRVHKENSTVGLLSISFCGSY